MSTGQSGIGQFVIGESAIGEGAEFDFKQTIISQYQNSPTLFQLIQNFFDYINPNANLDQFFDLIWNIDTAVGYGLDVWGRIVGISRIVSVPFVHVIGLTSLGFSEGADPLVTGFNQGPFFTGATSSSTTYTNYTLTDDQYRTVILAKALANISDGSTRGLNQVLLNLFPGRGNCYVRDNLDMSLTYVFDFTLTPAELATVVQSGVLPRPAGVSTSYQQN